MFVVQHRLFIIQFTLPSALYHKSPGLRAHRFVSSYIGTMPYIVNTVHSFPPDICADTFEPVCC